MTKKVKVLGKISLPKGCAKEAISGADKEQMKRNTVSNNFNQEHLCKVILSRLGEERLMNLRTGYLYDDNILCFQNVGKHNDDWQSLYIKGRRYAPGFLHVVLAGKFTLKMGRTKVELKRGDVFLMNPNEDHSVETKSKMCATYVCTVPIKDFWDKKYVAKKQRKSS